MSFAATAGLSYEHPTNRKEIKMPDKLHITEIGRVAVPAADQDRALEFYVGTLGFELRSEETFADGKMRWIEVAPAGGSTAIAIAPPMEDARPPSTPASSSPRATSRPTTPR